MTTTPLVALQRPKAISVEQIEAELSEIWRSQQSSGSLATRAATFSMVVYEPEEFQQLLATLGYYAGPIDGIYGPQTKQAINKAQRDYGLLESGRIDRETLSKLRETMCSQADVAPVKNANFRGLSISDALASQNPCRIITLSPVLNQKEPVEAKVSAYCPINKGKDDQLMCCEYITLQGSKTDLQGVGELATSLLIQDLPRFVWWKATPNPEQPLFKELAKASDCMIFDSSYFSEPESELGKLQTLLDNETYVADLNWHRLSAWQEMTAAAYDPPERRQALLCVDRVTIDYEKGNPAQALMFLGWLASRLGWQPTAFQVESKDGDEDSAERVSFKSSDDRAIEVELAGIHVEDWGEVPGDLVGLRMSSTNPEADCNTILCSETTGCMRMEAGGSAQSAKTEQVAPPTDETAEALMAKQLQSWGRNVLYEESLALTVEILKLKG